MKSVRQLGCVSQDAEPPESVSFLRKGTKVFGLIRRDNKAPPLHKIQVKRSHQRSPYSVKFEDRSQRPKDKSDAPAATRGNLPRISWSSEKRKKLHSIRLPMSGVLPAASTIKARDQRVCGGFWSKHACGQQERP